MTGHEQQQTAKKKGAKDNAGELEEGSLDEVAGGQGTCIPTDPLIVTTLPCPIPAPIDYKL